MGPPFQGVVQDSSRKYRFSPADYWDTRLGTKLKTAATRYYQRPPVPVSSASLPEVYHTVSSSLVQPEIKKILVLLGDMVKVVEHHQQKPKSTMYRAVESTIETVIPFFHVYLNNPGALSTFNYM